MVLKMLERYPKSAHICYFFLHSLSKSVYNCMKWDESERATALNSLSEQRVNIFSPWGTMTSYSFRRPNKNVIMHENHTCLDCSDLFRRF